VTALSDVMGRASIVHCTLQCAGALYSRRYVGVRPDSSFSYAKFV
jgi:hypothetical protein